MLRVRNNVPKATGDDDSSSATSGHTNSLLSKGKGAASSSSSSWRQRAMMAASKRSGGNNSSNKFGLLDVGIGVLVSLALLLTMITYVFPGQVQRVEQEAEREVGQYLNDFGNHNNNHKNNDPDYDSVPSILENNNNMHWVDGEQKLKRELEILAQRQRDGIDVGVPVLTRWLGDDIPAWPTRHADHRRMTEAEWTKRVEEAYAQMRRDEAAWRAEMTRYLESEVAAVG